MNKKNTLILIIILCTVFISVGFVFAKEKCTVSIKKPAGFPEIENGKIPIGEAVDESELLVKNLIDEMENIINEIPNMKRAVTELLPLPDLCGCGRTNCNTDDLTSYEACDCQCEETVDGYICDCGEQDYCECECSSGYIYDYKENCSCSKCNNFDCEYKEELGECVCANNCECKCDDEITDPHDFHVCKDSGCECDCECEYDAISGECDCECENCTPKNPEYECECSPKTPEYTDCKSPPCRNYAVIKKCCSILGCHCNYCYCTTCSGCDVCPSAEISIRINATAGDFYKTCEKNPWSVPCCSIGNINLRITDSFNKINNLIECESDIPDDPNRWKILNKLIDSREKFEKCIKGYSFVKKENKQPEQLFSCDMILREKYVNKTAILGYFEKKENKYPHCYPFTIEVQDDDPECKNNLTDKCYNKIVNMGRMDNYFCCKGE